MKTIADRISLTTNTEVGLSDVDMVIEAVPEDVNAKREVFSRLDQICHHRTILASNSSSIRISCIENSTRRPDRVLNMHFWIPVWQTTMVELMGGTATSIETMEAARRFVVGIGLTPLVARKESTGFVFNRVWHVIKKECLQLVDQGIASPDEIDQAWKIFTSMPYGPFLMMDVVGLDIVCGIEAVYYNESGDISDAPPGILLDKIRKGELGVKAGKGFYNYGAKP
jgi:3-hydroxybutyryl-CoA dehydrogenase